MVSTRSAGDNLSIESPENDGPIDDDFETDESDDDRDSPPSVKMHATLKKMKTRSPPSVKPRTNKKLKIVDEAVLVQDSISDSDPIPESPLIKDWEFFFRPDNRPGGRKKDGDQFDTFVVPKLPKQGECDCGIFVIKYAEFFLHGCIEKLPNPLPVQAFRNKIAVKLYNHGAHKIEKNCGSDSENVGRNNRIVVA
ncbi:uncharacterized protein LOC133834124 [Humulus lupulus]|uniref:uncharacterized protein LOC133834124 n=1 Tax=Humulus lupulus TaxID=3486 RepID=UPI002B406373|nr:uncharacterized protein LOC133834124 [Humulus lupulus]